ncbi:amino acid/polyamine transporter I [Aspergillus nidulans var. acristatus]
MSIDAQENSDKARMTPVLERSETQHEGQVAESRLEQTRFSLWSTIGIQFAVATPPLAIPSYTVLIVGAGGSPFFFWAFLLAAVGQMLIAFSLAELASAYPDASGQVYWTAAAVRSPRWKAFLSYLSGAMAFFGWIFACGGGAVLTAHFVTGLGVLISETYSPSTWQIYLLVLAAFLCAVLFNTLLIQTLPAISIFMIVFLNAAALFIFITLLAKTHPKASAETAFLDVLNETGWDSDGVVFFLSIMPGLLTICLFDTAAHMAEELPQPERQVPIVMLANAGLAVVSALIMVIALIFCTTHPENLTAPLAGLPILQICWDAWPSKGYVIVICIIYWASMLNALVSMLTGCSRLTWSFTKLGSLRYKAWLSQVHPTLHVPSNAVYFSAFLAILFSLLVFGPSTVLNGLFGSATLCFSISYALPIGLTLVNRARLPAQRYCNLGKFGAAVNMLALAWILIAIVFASFPTYLPVTSETINWAPCFFGIVLVLSLGNWILAQESYEPPRGLLVAGLDRPGHA